MSPRPYNMGKRAASVELTRRRIREAALLEYAENGIAQARMQSIARRADVAPGTVIYHYPDADELAEEVIAERREAMAFPTMEGLDGQAPLGQRIEWLTRELFRVYGGTELEYHAWMLSRDHPVMRHYEQWYDEAYTAALTAALGPDHGDLRAFQVVSALVDPGFRGSLITRGLSHEDAVTETVRLVLAWLGARSP